MEMEVQQSQTVAALLREAIGEENVKEVSIEGSINDVWTRVRTILDPFYIRVDDESLVRTVGDLQDGDDPLPMGDYATFCAHTLQQSGWLVPGKDEFVSQVRGRVYKFFGEKEQQYFKDNVAIF